MFALMVSLLVAAGSDPLTAAQGTAYRTMGLSNIDGQQVAEQLSVKITASTSEFTLRAGNVELLYTFLSPVEVRCYDHHQAKPRIAISNPCTL